jgi:hypothetical protein
MKKFYIIDNTTDTFASFWKPRARGRTHDLSKAGMFSEEEIKTAYYRNNPDILFVPVDSIGVEMVIVAVWNNLAKSAGDKFLQ